MAVNPALIKVAVHAATSVNIFDFLNESALVEQPFMLKKISSAQIDLSAFAKKEALSIGCYKYLAYRPKCRYK